MKKRRRKKALCKFRSGKILTQLEIKAILFIFRKETNRVLLNITKYFVLMQKNNIIPEFETGGIIPINKTGLITGDIVHVNDIKPNIHEDAINIFKIELSDSLKIPIDILEGRYKNEAD